jgi:hypothetical protein
VIIKVFFTLKVENMKRLIKTGVVIMLLFGTSCQKEKVTNPSSVNASSVNNSSTSFYIGQHYGGGVIFYIDSTGEHGLIADTADLGSFIWSDAYYIETGATKKGIGAGKSNTRKIISVLVRSYDYAALECAKSERNGYTDWFLPSKDQLYALWQQRDVVGGFAIGYKYYSSTERTSRYAIVIQFDSTGRRYYALKNWQFPVRSIREF